MDIKISGKNIEITSAIKEYIEKKLERLEKFSDRNTSVSVICSVERENQIVEMQVNYNGEFIKIEEKNNDLYASIDLAIDRVERQMRKEKEKKSNKNKAESIKDKFINLVKGNHTEKDEITKTICYEIKPISVEDAKLKLKEKKDMFMPFVNVDTNAVNVIYKRDDETYGIVIPE